MNSRFAAWREAGLVWLPDRGMGYYPVTESPYDEQYWKKYRDYEKTDLGVALTKTRAELVNSYLGIGRLVDIGVGSGAFLSERLRYSQQTFGYDINPVAVRWLVEKGLYLDPVREGPVDTVTLWDTFEHIHDPAPLLASVRNLVFLSIPIFTGPDHVLNSRHFRKDEHCWYFTRQGLIGWMLEHGFNCEDHRTTESLLGREDIDTFVFRRIAQP